MEKSGGVRRRGAVSAPWTRSLGGAGMSIASVWSIRLRRMDTAKIQHAAFDSASALVMRVIVGRRSNKVCRSGTQTASDCLAAADAGAESAVQISKTRAKTVRASAAGAGHVSYKLQQCICI